MKKSNYYPISKIQEYFLEKSNLTTKNVGNNIKLLYKIDGSLKQDSFESALVDVIKKHQIIGSQIVFIDNSVQNFIPPNFILGNYFKVFTYDCEYSMNLYEEYLLNEINKPFQLKGGYLFKARLYKFTDTAFLSFVFHQTIIDSQSSQLFISDLSNFYDARFKQLNPEKVENYLPYAAFADLSNEWILSKEATILKKQWSIEFEKSIDPIELPFINNVPHEITTGNRINFDLPNKLAGGIREFASQKNVTTFISLLSAWAIFLHRITGQNNFNIGVPVSIRPDNFKKTIGCFENILPIKFEFSSETTFMEVVNLVHQNFIKNIEKQNVPFDEIKAILKSKSTSEIFQTGFKFEEAVDLQLVGLKVENVPVTGDYAQHELFMVLCESEHTFSGFIEYNTTKFNNEFINELIDSFFILIDSLLEHNFEKVDSLNFITNKNKQFVEQINSTSSSFEDRICLHHKFEEQVDKTPNAAALISSAKTLSYLETERSVNNLANYLTSKGIKEGDVIALCSERCIEMMVSVLAILKTGAAYLPLHLENPKERMQVILDDAKPSFILCSEAGSRNIDTKNSIIFIDKIIERPLGNNNSRPSFKMGSSNLAYILYTSGSTGMPKGTLIEHKSVMNRIGWMQKQYPLNQGDVLLQKTPVTFDVSVWELFWWFFNGSKLVLLNHDGEKDPSAIISYIETYAVSRIHFVPSMFTSFLYAIKHKSELSKLINLKTIFLSGESLPVSLVNEFNELRDIYPLPQLVNLYGPTEATVDVSYYNCPNKLNKDDKIYIGKPIDNTELYIVNSAGKVQPLNIKGELLITGVNLSRGYLNRKELTDTSFIKFTKSNGKEVRAYKTGDICVLRSNGEIEYIGRSDNQIKIRGLRVEIGEIESKILQHPDVMNAATIVAFEDDKKAIVAYVEIKEGHSTSENNLLKFLASQLPSYMVPSIIVILNKMPINANGKTDKKALPLPDFNKKKGSMEKPIHNVEKQLSKIWSELLNLSQISLNDNLFDIGGNSLLCIKLSLKINKVFKVNASVMSTMEYPNIKEYGKYLIQLLDGSEVNTITEEQQTLKRKRITPNRSRRYN